MREPCAGLPAIPRTSASEGRRNAGGCAFGPPRPGQPQAPLAPEREGRGAIPHDHSTGRPAIASPEAHFDKKRSACTIDAGLQAPLRRACHQPTASTSRSRARVKPTYVSRTSSRLLRLLVGGIERVRRLPRVERRRLGVAVVHARPKANPTPIKRVLEPHLRRRRSRRQRRSGSCCSWS